MRSKLLDATGQTHGLRRVAHDRAAVLTALAWIREQTQAAPAQIAVGLETPHGVLVDTLIDQGFAVFAANPKQIDRFRDRFTMAGAKDDLVPIDHSRKIRDAFDKEQVTNKLVEFENAGHGFGPDVLPKAVEEMIAWFETHLAAK